MYFTFFFIYIYSKKFQLDSGRLRFDNLAFDVNAASVLRDEKI